MANPTTPNHHAEKMAAAQELIATTKRNLQLVDVQLEALQAGRIAVQTADDISTEHRIAMFGFTDDSLLQDDRGLYSDTLDQGNGIFLGDLRDPSNFGLTNPHYGRARIQEDAAFVCTNIMASISRSDADDPSQPTFFLENAANDYTGQIVPYLRLTDANTGRELIAGLTHGPFDRNRGAVPLSFLSSFRFGLGSNVKNKFFSEFTIPRAGVVKAEVFNLGVPKQDGRENTEATARVFLTLFGFKVYGA